MSGQGKVGTFSPEEVAQLKLEGPIFVTKATVKERPGYESHPGDEDRGAWFRAMITVPNGIEQTGAQILISHEFNMHHDLKPGDEIVIVVGKASRKS